MNWDWLNSGSYRELIFIALAIIGYSLYLGRVSRLARQLKQRRRWAFFKVPLRLLYFGLFMVALLGPTFGISKKYIEASGKDIYLLIDLSQSMEVRDVSPSRFEKIRYELKNLIQSQKNNRYGIIGFAEEAFLQCPLTYDKAALNLFLQTLDTDLAPGEGTQFEPPLEIALRSLLESEEKRQSFKSKLVILFSDGENFDENLSPILQKYKENDIHVLSLAIGSEQGAKIIKGNNYLRDAQGRLVISKIHTTSLMRIANETGGDFYMVNPLQNDFVRLEQDLENMKDRKVDRRNIQVADNQYIYFLALATALFFLDLLIGIKILEV